MLKVAFVCVHNSCRSQMAEAITKLTAHECMRVYSAGTEKKEQINQDAVEVIKKLYNVPLCHVSTRKTGGLDDPTGKPLDIFRETALSIEQRIKGLKLRIKNNMIFKERNDGES